MERVEKLASRQNHELRISSKEGVIKSEAFSNRPGYRMLVPLHHIIAEAFGVAPTSQKVINEYTKLVTSLGGEIKVLTKASVDEIAKVSGGKIAEGIDKNRRGDLVIDPGYDGVYGVVKIWKDMDKTVDRAEAQIPQLLLFD
jgi:PHP family Zn ribbon phosphoesterase